MDKLFDFVRIIADLLQKVDLDEVLAIIEKVRDIFERLFPPNEVSALSVEAMQAKAEADDELQAAFAGLPPGTLLKLLPILLDLFQRFRK